MKNLILGLFVFLQISISAEEKHFIIVSADGSGDYKTLIEAVEALPMFVYQRRVIFIKNGIYEERIRIDQDNITLLGEGREKTYNPIQSSKRRMGKNKDHIGHGVIRRLDIPQYPTELFIK